MAATNNQKKLDYRQVDFDVNNIAPDAPAGEWGVSIPRGKCKIQPTKEDRYPMLIVPIRLDSTPEDDEALKKVLGTELSTMIVFFGDEKPKAARMSKLRLTQLCAAADVDLDVVPKRITDPDNDLEPLVRALEGKKFTAWTKLQTRKDTGEVVSEISFIDPNQTLRNKADEDDDDEEDDDRPARGRKKTSSRSNGNGARRR